jgi:hypothetical protein
MRMIIFTLQPLYIWGKKPSTHWIGGLVGTQNQSGCFGEAWCTSISLWNCTCCFLIVPQWQQHEFDMNMHKMGVILLHQGLFWTYSKRFVGENCIDLKYFGLWCYWWRCAKDYKCHLKYFSVLLKCNDILTHERIKHIRSAVSLM